MTRARGPLAQQALVDAIRWPAALLRPDGCIAACNEAWVRVRGEQVGERYELAPGLDAKLGALWADQTKGVDEVVDGPLGPYQVRAQRLCEQVLVFHEPSTQGDELTPVTAAFDSSPVAQAVVAVDGRLLALNQAAHEQLRADLGVEPRVGQSLVALLREPEASRLGAALGRALTGEHVEYERRTVGTDGRPRYHRVSFQPVRRVEGGPVVGALLGRAEVTARREAEEAATMTARLASFKRFADSLPTLVSSWTTHEECVFANAAHARWYGRPSEALVGVTLADLVGPGPYELIAPYVKRALLGSVQVVEREQDLPGVGPRLLQATYTPNVEDGVVKGFFSLITDITDRRNLEFELRQAQKMDAVGQLATGVAHDFNNLLTLILAATRNLQDGIERASPLQKEVEEVLSATDRATRLTRQLMTFGRRELTAPTTVNLGELVDGLQSILRRLLRPTVRLQFTRGETGVVKADHGQLEQVLLNLVGNAQDAMPEGGTLSVATSTVRVERDPVLPPGEYAALAVSDTGVGMDAATLLRAYEPFFTTKERGKAAGLGLPTAFAIARQSGGVLRAQSTPGQGSTFTVLLPRLHSKVTMMPARVPPPRPHGVDTILIVEDDLDILKVTSKSLARRGCQVLTARDAPTALKLLGNYSGPLDLLFADLVLPGMDGVELAKAVREKRPEVRVLYASGYADERTALEEAEASGDGFIAKPYTPESLWAKIRLMLGPTEPSLAAGAR